VLPVLPYLDPALAVLWRAPEVLQVGLDPARAWALDGAPRMLPALLGRLRGRADAEEVLASLRGSEHHEAGSRALDLLEQAGALRHGDPADQWDQAWVEVVGESSGLLPRAVHERLREVLGRVSRADAPSALRPDLVVLATDAGRGLAWAEALMGAGTPHLWAHVRDGRAVVGPLVQPGRTPCLRCLDLHRTDSDPAWPRLALGWEQSPAPTATPRLLAATRLTAELAVGQVLRHLVGDPGASLGGTLEEQPDGTVVVRAWPAHPGCGCAWAWDVPQPRVPGGSDTAATAAGRIGRREARGRRDAA
jgi:bacteriocin biosynthesis cyclodehydratase domain-containing protein